MPRLSTKQYLRSHKQLRHLWLNAQMVFGYLSQAEQRHLHDFYHPADDLTDEQLLAHRLLVTNRRPGLPHDAGRALAKLRSIAATHAVRRVHQRALAQTGTMRKRSAQREREVQVLAAVNPHMTDESLGHLVAAMVMHDLHQKNRRSQNDNSAK